eukprot:9591076-Lingulodinium_polyedra.AAC.1
MTAYQAFVTQRRARHGPRSVARATEVLRARFAQFYDERVAGSSAQHQHQPAGVVEGVRNACRGE